MPTTRPKRDPSSKLGTGLYLITPDESDALRLLDRVAPLLPFATCLQLRCKSMQADALREAAALLRAACRTEAVAFIVNDDARLAREIGADGVHLGEHDGAIADARALLGDSAMIGVSCYASLQRARDAAADGADYLAFGAFFPSPTKPGARRATLDLLRDSAALGLPRVAIGGITADNAGTLIAAGADLVAVIGGVFDAPDPVAAARSCQNLFDADQRG